ncbi:MAG TPA: class I SAM-dependent methyltransferase [Flavobacteriales bacterium]|nr:class I SAM-dependent methyltransferase [Flavobacteriales bacterium]
MKTKLQLIRKTKLWFVRLKLHVLFGPFVGAMEQLVHLTRMSQWVNNNRQLAYNDFPHPKWDYNKRFEFYAHLRANVIGEGAINYLEFGVSQGHSFKWWVANQQNLASRFHGFDTFTGLPEDWGVFKAGAMSTGSRVPDVTDARAQFHVGLFQDTLPGFLASFNRSGKLLLQLDADLYTSTLYVLTSVAPFLRPGDVIMFDEFFVPTHEFKAFQEFVASYRIAMEPVAAANNYYFTAFVVK